MKMIHASKLKPKKIDRPINGNLANQRAGFVIGI